MKTADKIDLLIVEVTYYLVVCPIHWIVTLFKK